MRSNDVLGFIFAGTLDDKIPELAASRTTASVPIGGKYRLIDFVLSNMSNSGINNVGIVAKSNFLSLTDHVGSGSAYDLSKRRSNLTLLTPYDGKPFSNYVETIYNMHGYIEHCREEYILLSPTPTLHLSTKRALYPQATTVPLHLTLPTTARLPRCL